MQVLQIQNTKNLITQTDRRNFGSFLKSKSHSKNDPPAPNVYVVHVGHQDHATFLDLLRHSELPVQITGDASLSEAVSLNKIFLYDPPVWKGHVFSSFVKLAADYLEDWRDVDRIRSLFGCCRV